jgi:hypothetical protein
MKMSHVGLAGTMLLFSSLAMPQAPATDATAGSTAAPAAKAAPTPGSSGKLSYTDDYRIAVNHDADSDGENVIIERSWGNEDMSLVLVSSTVKGITAKVHRD